jgi:hypothetical protein
MALRREREDGVSLLFLEDTPRGPLLSTTRTGEGSPRDDDDDDDDDSDDSDT